MWQKHMAVRAQGGGDRDRAAVLVPTVTWGLPGGGLLEVGEVLAGTSCLSPVRSLPGQGDVIAARSSRPGGGRRPATVTA